MSHEKRQGGAGMIDAERLGLPWRVDIMDATAIIDADGRSVAEMDGTGRGQALARAALAGRAVNSHDQLVEACRRARGWFGQFGYNHYGIAVADDAPDPEEVVRELRAALAEAKVPE